MSLLQARGLTALFGGVRAVDGVDLDIEQGTIHGLIGPNGAGKTTLINLMSGLIAPTAGTLTFDGEAGGPWPIGEAVDRGIVRTFQQTRAFLGLTVRENFRIASTAGDHPVDKEMLDSFGLSEVLDVKAGELSYAQIRRLGIALALTLRPKLILLDEPAVGLTAGELARMGEIIRERRAAGVTILLVEHNMRFLMALSDVVTVLARGKVLFEGTPAQCQSNPIVIETYLGTGG